VPLEYSAAPTEREGEIPGDGARMPPGDQTEVLISERSLGMTGNVGRSLGMVRGCILGMHGPFGMVWG
jgi:hypothetical protein